MKRTPKKTLKTRRIIAWSVLIVAVLIALLILFFPELFPPITYDELSEKTVTVSSFERIYKRGGSSFRLYTEEGDAFAITGDFDHDIAANALQSGVTATVKRYPNSLNPFLDCAEEITVNGEMIVAYNNDKPIERIPLVLISAAFVLVGAGYAAGSLLWTKHLQTFDEKRDKRIKRKYGNKM